jgi:large subunit ribosomal protein L6
MDKAKKKTLDIEMEIPQGIEVKVENTIISVKGPKGEVKKNIAIPNVKVESKDNKVLIKAKKNTKREKKLIGTLKANLKNMFKGSSELHKYSLKVCSGHFPMKVEVKGDTLTLTNFIGEKHPRKLKLKEGVNVKVEGDLVNVEGADKDIAGQTAADIEQLTRRTNFDSRIFQDGIYITNKDGKEIK